MIYSVLIVACFFGIIAVSALFLTRHFWGENHMTDEPPRCYKDSADWAHLAAGALFGATGLLSLSAEWSTAASLAIVVSVDFYLAVVLILIAIRSDRRKQGWDTLIERALPHRLFALFSSV